MHLHLKEAFGTMNPDSIEITHANTYTKNCYIDMIYITKTQEKAT